MVQSNVGASRGFAFVEFVALEDAVRWMDAKQVMRVIHPVDRGQRGMSERERDRLSKKTLSSRTSDCSYSDGKPTAGV